MCNFPLCFCPWNWKEITALFPPDLYLDTTFQYWRTFPQCYCKLSRWKSKALSVWGTLLFLNISPRWFITFLRLFVSVGVQIRSIWHLCPLLPFMKNYTKLIDISLGWKHFSQNIPLLPYRLRICVFVYQLLKLLLYLSTVILLSTVQQTEWLATYIFLQV